MNEFLGRMKLLLGGPSGEGANPVPADATPESLVDRVLDDIEAKRKTSPNWWSERTKFTDLPAFRELTACEPAFQAAAGVAAVVQGNRLFGGTMTSYFREGARLTLASQIVRRALPFTESQLVAMLDDASRRHYPETETPIASVLGAVERFCGGEKPPSALRGATERFRDRMLRRHTEHGQSQASAKLLSRTLAILDPAATPGRVSIPRGDWSYAALEWVKKQGDYEQAWCDLLSHAATASDKSRPAAKWIVTAKPLIAALGEAQLAAQIIAWMDELTPDPAHPDASLDVLKGLVWCAKLLQAETVATPIGRFAETCFRKVPNIGARSVKLGNACITTLAAMAPDENAIAELVRLKSRLKYASAKSILERQLVEIATEQGVTVSDLEEGSLPTYDLDGEGKLEVLFGDIKAVIAVSEDGAKLEWIDSKGKIRAGPTAAIKSGHTLDLKSLKQKAKDVAAAHAGQVAMIEDGWIAGRSWPLPVWRRRFLDHPLREPIVRALIWRIDTGGKTLAAMPGKDGWRNASGEPVDLPADSTIALWHPLDSDPDDVISWRRYIVERGFTQPIKQAHREIYVLTNAELRTETYSNRFAAHILRQHQFRSLCHARGWSYQFQGGWDSFNIPVRRLERRDLMVEYHVDGLGGDDMGQSGVFLHVSTDQVRFSRLSGQRINLIDVPPIIFSELMRDVDLFVAVCSVANDPDWVDGGPQGRYGDYWTAQAFGDLGETAKTRRDLIALIAPRLAIADQLSIDGNFLNVRGVRQEYRIHLGSSNIQILPSNRYLCIVRDAAPKGEKTDVRLPFAGDSLLAMILSKAFMLAADDRITDPSILRQL
jgi:hypothetical protein